MTFQHAFVNPLKLEKVTQEDGNRRYVTPNGDHYESVTTFIGRHWDKSFLLKWKAKIGEEKAEKIKVDAARRGTALHKITESYLLNNLTEEVNDDPNTKALFTKIKPLLDRLNNIRLLETPLYSDKLQLAGTPDCIAEYSNTLAVVDFKTSTRVKKKTQIVDYFLQCACYAEMFYEHFNEMPQKAVIIMAIPDLPYGMTYMHDMDVCLKMLQKFREDPVSFQAKLK